MKKIPCLFEREFNENGEFVNLTQNSKFDSVFNGKADATLKIDGTACMIKDNELWVRYNAKNGKPVPEGAIQCGEPDPITGHNPCWVKASVKNGHKWQIKAFENTVAQFPDVNLIDGTYECIGKHFSGNPYGLTNDVLVLHGFICVELKDVSYDGIKKWLSEHNDEGLVFWEGSEPICKIRCSDYFLDNWKNHDPEKSLVRNLINEDGTFAEDCKNYLSSLFQIEKKLTKQNDSEIHYDIQFVDE